MLVTKVTVVLCLVGLSMAGDFKKLFKKHAEKKTMQACFGEKVSMDYFKLMIKYKKECENSKPLTVPRGKRALFTADKIRGIKDEALSKTATLVCVLQKFKVIDSNFNLLPAAMKTDIQAMNIDAELKTDLMENVDKCNSYVSCINFDEKAHLLPSGVMRAFAFVKCEKKKKWISCIKKDLRKHANYFDLQGLDGLMDDAEDDDKMFNIMMAYTMNH